MGSQIVKALIQQIAKWKTNPNNVVDQDDNDVSRPLLQSGINLSSSLQRIEQRNVSSAPNIGQVSPSRPVEQVGTVSPDADYDSGLLEQLDLERSEGGPASPIEQLGFSSSIFSGATDVSKIIEQRNLISASTTSKPIEQTAQISNTINVEQFDFIDLIFPNCNSIRNPVDTNILVRLRNFGFVFNLDTVVFRVNGIDVQDSDSFFITPLVNGIQIDYDPPDNFDYGTQVDVFIQIRDTASIPRTFIFKCSFFTTPDTVGPKVQNFTLCNKVDVGSFSSVEFDVVDLETGVDPNSIKLSIEGIEVCGGITLDPLTTSGTNGFHVTWQHPDTPFRYGSKVTAAVEAEDLADPANGSLFVCTFRVENSTPPEFINIVPEPCKSFVDNTTGLTFEVYGVRHGIDISTLDVQIDSSKRKVYVRPRIRRVE